METWPLLDHKGKSHAMSVLTSHTLPPLPAPQPNTVRSCLPLPPASSPKFSLCFKLALPVGDVVAWPRCLLCGSIHFVRIHQAMYLWFMHFSKWILYLLFFLISPTCPYIHAIANALLSPFPFLPGNLIPSKIESAHMLPSLTTPLQPSNLRVTAGLPFMCLSTYMSVFLTKRHSYYKKRTILFTLLS